MATQGLVTVRKGGEVVMKIVAGMDGMKANQVANAVAKLGRAPTVDEAWRLAIKRGFGHAATLVVMTATQVRQGGDNGRLDRRYRRTFHRPEFNPGWKHGTADHIKVVDF
ncbi:MAG: hypothetical protein EXS55_00930 [Candidatus Magasanikbacteria bacterium]|nr:hypothetical protein [Candidatus Magasanikbacteria bacterium]